MLECVCLGVSVCVCVCTFSVWVSTLCVCEYLLGVCEYLPCVCVLWVRGVVEVVCLESAEGCVISSALSPCPWAFTLTQLSNKILIPSTYQFPMQQKYKGEGVKERRMHRRKRENGREVDCLPHAAEVVTGTRTERGATLGEEGRDGKSSGQEEKGAESSGQTEVQTN